MKALVTGGAGFIGSHLADYLLHMGHEVVVVDNLKSGQLKNLQRLPCLKFVHCDIRDRRALEPLFENVDWVFHLAGLADIVPSIELPREYMEVNVDGTFNVLECARASCVKRFIYAASSSCYGLVETLPTNENAPISPQYPYALTKNLGEQLVLHWAKVYHLPALCLRLFNVYGPRSRTTGAYGAVFGVFLTQKLHGKPFTVVGDGTQTRDFTYVTDVAEAFYKAAASHLTDDIFNVGSSHHYSINYLCHLLGGDVVYIPKRPGEPQATFADSSKIKTMLNWTPKITFEEGVKRMLNCIEDYRDAPLWHPENIKQATKSWFQHLQNESVCS
jgi:UDP-glucose 4-epimerase